MEAKRDPGPHHLAPVPSALTLVALRIPGAEKPQQSGWPQGQSGPVSRHLPSSAAQLEPGSRVKITCLTQGTETGPKPPCAPAVSQRQDWMAASFLVPSLPGARSPGDNYSTPTLSIQDHFWEPASLPTPSIYLWRQPQRKESDTGFISGEEDEGPFRG